MRIGAIWADMTETAIKEGSQAMLFGLVLVKVVALGLSLPFVKE